MAFRATVLERRQQHGQRPSVAITTQAAPPDAAFELQLDGLLLHQLIHQLVMLMIQIRHELSQIPPLRFGELDRPSLSTDEHRIIAPGGIPGQSPAGPLLLNHRLSQAAGRADPARR